MLSLIELKLCMKFVVGNFGHKKTHCLANPLAKSMCSALHAFSSLKTQVFASCYLRQLTFVAERLTECLKDIATKAVPLLI